MVKKNITIEDLAVMIQHGFAETALKADTATKAELSGVKKELSGVKTELSGVKTELSGVKKDMEEGFFAVNRRLDLLREDISDLPVIREELKDLDERLVRVERKVSSGK